MTNLVARITKFALVLALFCSLPAACKSPTASVAEPAPAAEQVQQGSDHFDGKIFFNPGMPLQPASGDSRRSRWGFTRWIRYWVFRPDWPEWPKMESLSPAPPPAARVPMGHLCVTVVGHATFLIQIDGLNILTDPIWSSRCSPFSWVGPSRHRQPGIRFEDLPPIDAVLLSHNHYDHLDRPTLEDLSKKGARRCLTPLGNGDIIRSTGIRSVSELDWWQSERLSPDVTVTLVPAQHFSSRTLWDRNTGLWGGFVISAPWGEVFFAGDTGYGPHFREIALRFPSIRLALLPIAPFRPHQSSQQPPPPSFQAVHMGPAEAVQAHLDLGARQSLAGHFQVFQLGPDDFEDAAKGLGSASRERGLKSDAFIALPPGQSLSFKSCLPASGTGR